jgi:hypothetical protein
MAPLQFRTGEQINYKKLRVFGCPAQIFVREKERLKRGRETNQKHYMPSLNPVSLTFIEALIRREAYCNSLGYNFSDNENLRQNKFYVCRSHRVGLDPNPHSGRVNLEMENNKPEREFGDPKSIEKIQVESKKRITASFKESHFPMMCFNIHYRLSIASKLLEKTQINNSTAAR